MKPHNKNKRRRERKAMWRVLRDPIKREEVLREMAIRRTPLKAKKV